MSRCSPAQTISTPHRELARSLILDSFVLDVTLSVAALDDKKLRLDSGGTLRGDPRGARLVVLHQRTHGVPWGLLRLPQACGALPGCDLQHPPPGALTFFLCLCVYVLVSPKIRRGRLELRTQLSTNRDRGF